jgi:hypothetical protein
MLLLLCRIHYSLTLSDGCIACVGSDFGNRSNGIFWARLELTQGLVKGERLKEVKVMHRSRMKRRSLVLLLVILRDVAEEATKVDILRVIEDNDGDVISSNAQNEVGQCRYVHSHIFIHPCTSS